jgi:hypothetical protein
MPIGGGSSVPAASSRMKSVRGALLVALCSLGPAAAQQSPSDRIRDETLQAPITSACIPRATRAAPSCDPVTTVAHVEKQQTFVVDLPKPDIKYCAAAIGVEYTQRNTLVRVVSTIENADCAASSGEYEVSVRVRDANLDVKKLDFTEPWQRNDAKSMTFAHDYPIGTNVDVLSVHGHSLECRCADVAQQPAR